MLGRLVLAAPLAALVLAAGCGGSDEESDPAAAWAADFCTAVTSWTDELQTVTSSFSDTSNLSQEGLQSGAENVRAATDRLVDDIRELGAPDTESGRQVESALNTLAETLEAESGKISDTADGISSIADLPSAISSITSSLSAMGSAFSSALQTIESADVGEELQTALEDSPECADISG